MADFKKAVEILNKNFPFWTTRVLNIGEPVLDASLPMESACIAFDKDADEWSFRFHPNFLKSLTNEEAAFIMSHEAMHVVRNDMRTAVYGDDTGPYEVQQALNIATDLIINDTLKNAGMKPARETLLGTDILGMDCEGKPTREVYEAVLEKFDDPNPDPDDEEGEGEGSGEGSGEEGEGDGDESEGEGDGDGEDDGEQKDGQSGDGGESDEEPQKGDGTPSKGGSSGEEDGSDGQVNESTGPMPEVPNHDWTEDMADRAETKSMHGDDAASKAVDGWEDDNERDGKMPPPIQAADIPRMDWAKLFSMLDPELVNGSGLGPANSADWRRPRTGTAHLRGIRLPAKREDARREAWTNKKPQIVVGIDSSGSVQPEDLAVFEAIRQQLPPDRAEYIFVSVGTTGKEIGAKEELRRMGGGDGLCHPTLEKYGSHLTICEAEAFQLWIREALRSKRLHTYPKSVIFITDCITWCADMTPAEAKRWLVLHNSKTRNAFFDPRYRRSDSKHDRSGHQCMLPPSAFHHMGDFILKS